jgi:hypothetical protein
MEIPLPKDGKTVGVGGFKKDIEGAYALARKVQFAENIHEMRNAYYEFREYIEKCLVNNNQ